MPTQQARDDGSNPRFAQASTFNRSDQELFLSISRGEHFWPNRDQNPSMMYGAVVGPTVKKSIVVYRNPRSFCV